MLFNTPEIGEVNTITGAVVSDVFIEFADFNFKVKSVIQEMVQRQVILQFYLHITPKSLRFFVIEDFIKVIGLLFNEPNKNYQSHLQNNVFHAICHCVVMPPYEEGEYCFANVGRSVGRPNGFR